jgi:hypothetical protein
MLLAPATTSPALVVGGVLLVEPALAAVAGNLLPERTCSAISVVASFGHGGFLLEPPLAGGLTEMEGVRVTLGVIVVVGLTVFFLSPRPREDQQKSVTS